MTQFNKVCVFVVVVFGILSLSEAAPPSIEDVFRNKHDVQRHYLCVMDMGPCDPLGATAKNLLIQVVNNKCARCNAQQIATFNRIVEIMRTQYPMQWSNILAKYTGNSNYRFQ